MATPRSQRIGIWIIAVTMALGTFGSFLAMIVGGQNNAKDQADLQKAYSKYQTEQKVFDDEYSAKLAVQTKELSDKYYSEFSKYSTANAEFKSDGIKTLSSKDLKKGDGEEIKKDTKYSAYYIGWNPRGVIFDQSIADGALKSPISSDLGLITGWQEGVIGMKFGGIRELTIPSDKAYGSADKGENIPPNTPLKFIVMVIPKVGDIPRGSAEMPDILLKYYQSQQQ